MAAIWGLEFAHLICLHWYILFIYLRDRQKTLESDAKKKNVGFAELFDETHKLPNGEFVDDRASDKSASYPAAMIEKYGPNEDDWPYIDKEIYLDTIGPPHKGRYCGSRTTGLGVDLEQVMTHITDIYKRMKEFTQQMRTEVEERYATSSSADSATVGEVRRQSMLDIEAFKDEIKATIEDKLKKLEDARHAEEEKKEQNHVQEQKERDAKFMDETRDMFRAELARGQGSQ